MKIEQKGEVTTVYLDASAGWEQWVMLRSDAHHDSKLCDRAVELRHLKLAQERKALIIDAGDTFDLMQGRFDNRRSYDEIRPEYLRDNYYDLAIDDAINFYAPFAKNFLVIGDGNHEGAVVKNANTNPNDRLVAGLNRAGGNVKHGATGGWVRFMYSMSGVPKGSLKLYYHHSGGSNSEAPVSKGVIQTNRQGVYLPDADIVLNGHTHTNYWLAIPRIRLSNKGEPYNDLCHFVRTPGYKRPGAWELSKGMQPKAVGCVFLRLGWYNDRPTVHITPEIEG